MLLCASLGNAVALKRVLPQQVGSQPCGTSPTQQHGSLTVPTCDTTALPGCCFAVVMLLQHGRVAATVSQQLKEQCAKSPLLWKELQQELKQELKAAKQDAKEARKGEGQGSMFAMAASPACTVGPVGLCWCHGCGAATQVAVPSHSSDDEKAVGIPDPHPMRMKLGTADTPALPCCVLFMSWLPVSRGCCRAAQGFGSAEAGTQGAEAGGCSTRRGGSTAAAAGGAAVPVAAVAVARDGVAVRLVQPWHMGVLCICLCWGR